MEHTYGQMFRGLWCTLVDKCLEEVEWCTHVDICLEEVVGCTHVDKCLYEV